MEEDDIEAVMKIAAHIRTPYNKHRPLNPLSSLPSSKAKLRKAIKERIRQLAGGYISLATFIDDDVLAFIERNPKSKRTRDIYMKVIKEIEKANKEIADVKLE